MHCIRDIRYCSVIKLIVLGSYWFREQCRQLTSSASARIASVLICHTMRHCHSSLFLHPIWLTLITSIPYDNTIVITVITTGIVIFRDVYRSKNTTVWCLLKGITIEWYREFVIIPAGPVSSAAVTSEFIRHNTDVFWPPSEWRKLSWRLRGLQRVIIHEHRCSMIGGDTAD